VSPSASTDYRWLRWIAGMLEADFSADHAPSAALCEELIDLLTARPVNGQGDMYYFAGGSPAGLRRLWNKRRLQLQRDLDLLVSAAFQDPKGPSGAVRIRRMKMERTPFGKGGKQALVSVETDSRSFVSFVGLMVLDEDRRRDAPFLRRCAYSDCQHGRNGAEFFVRPEHRKRDYCSDECSNRKRQRDFYANDKKRSAEEEEAARAMLRRGK
jgi:hypothetical protein